MYTLYNGDCLEIMKTFPDNCIDLVVTDVPWGDTKQKFDVPVDSVELMKQLRRVVKASGKIVIISNMRYGAKLIIENENIFKRHRVIKTKRKRNFPNCSHQDLINHYDVFIFYDEVGTYNPIKTTGHKPVNKFTKRTGNGDNYGTMDKVISGGGQTNRNPTSIIEIEYRDVRIVAKEENRKPHTQEKPKEFSEYFIKTYTNEGDVVLDCFGGSMKCADACIDNNREFIGIELDKEFYKTAERRLEVYGRK